MLSAKTDALKSDLVTSETLPPQVRVHVVGAGPVGLLLTALLQPTERFAVHLYEKRHDYTRTRMVKLASYLVADSVASYCTDYIDRRECPGRLRANGDQRGGSRSGGPFLRT